MFLRIYIGIITSIAVAVLISYVAYSGVNELRVKKHNETIYQGTFSLIRDGLRRHQGKKREEWLNIVQKLSGLNLVVNKVSPDISFENAEFVLAPSSSDTARYTVRIRINETEYLESDIESISEQQLRVALLLVLNELGRVDSGQLSAKLSSLQTHFAFPLTTVDINKSALDRTQLKRVRGGAIVVVLNSIEGQKDSHSVYALLGNKQNRLIVLGPIPTFVETPLWLMGCLLVLSSLIIGVVAYAMVRKLEVRLKTMSDLMDGFGAKNMGRRLQEQGDDAVAHLAHTFNGLAERIALLVDDQRHMSQAISHELRTPISRMKFRLDILASQSEANPSYLEKVEGLKRDIDELNNLVDEALFFQQTDSLSSIVTESIETILLPECLDELVQKVSPLAEDKHIEWVVEPGTQVRANGVYLRRLLQNLLVNALRHCAQEVRVTYKAVTDHHLLYVDDDGDGIEEHQKENLFQPFKRAESSRNKKLGGYGLGLAIVKRIAELHEGTVTIEASPLGGARFKFVWSKNL